MLVTTLKVTEKQRININPDGVLDGPVQITSSNPAVVIADWGCVMPVSAGMGVLTLAATSGGNPLTEEIQVTVEPVPATTLGVTLGPVEPK